MRSRSSCRHRPPACATKLEAIDAYREYSASDDSGLFLQLLGDELRHAELLLAALRVRIG
jgi:hypothetical protein